MTIDQMAMHFANAALGGFALGWVTCLVFMRWRDRRRPPPF
jgi:hypothetical protein